MQRRDVILAGAVALVMFVVVLVAFLMLYGVQLPRWSFGRAPSATATATPTPDIMAVARTATAPTLTPIVTPSPTSRVALSPTRTLVTIRTSTPVPPTATATPTITPTPSPSLTPTITPVPPTPAPPPPTVPPTPRPPTNTPLPPTATATRTPAPTATPTPRGQNCPEEPVVGATFAGAWEQSRGLIGCPKGTPIPIELIAEEPFQGGHMIWRNDTDLAYVILDRDKGTGETLTQGTWQFNPEWKWDGSNPGGVGMIPPPGLVEPKQGFGYAWRTFLGGPEGALGWALEAESGFEDVGEVQAFEAGEMYKGKAPVIYVLLADGTFRRYDATPGTPTP